MGKFVLIVIAMGSGVSVNPPATTMAPVYFETPHACLAVRDDLHKHMAQLRIGYAECFPTGVNPVGGK